MTVPREVNIPSVLGVEKMKKMSERATSMLPGLPSETSRLKLRPPHELAAETWAERPDAELWLFVCCGRESLTGAPERFCPVCGRKLDGQPYLKPEGE